MVEKAKNPSRSSITEEDTATLLQRYTPTTVLALLQEVAHFPEADIDWDQLVTKTSTGISSAREYQMLWRHLAYREGLVDNCDNNGTKPLNDDSDLEYESEAFPAVSAEDSREAAACVKVLISSGLASDSTHRSGATVEAPLTINIPNGQSSRTNQSSRPTCSMQQLNITVPVSVKKQPLPSVTTPTVATAEGGDANGSASNSTAPRKKRKKWSEAEDLELIAAVRKYGEANWANIIKGDFKGERNANQLAQRWSYIKKNHRDLDLTGSSSGKLSQAQLDARYSLSVALEGPKIKAKTIGTAGTNATSNSVLTTVAEAEPQAQQGFNPGKPNQIGLVGSTTKSQVTSKKTLTKPNSNSDGLIRATAVAAGARIAAPSDAASLVRAASLVKATQLELPPTVHYRRTSLAAAPLSTPPSTAITPGATDSRSFKALPQASLHTPTNGTLLSKRINGVSGSLDTELPSNQEVVTAEGSMIAEQGCAPPEQVEGGAIIPRNRQDDQVQEDKVDSSDHKAELKSLLTNAENPVGSLNIGRDETDNEGIVSVQAEEGQSANDNMILSDPSAVRSCEKQSASEKQTDVRSIATDGCNEKQVSSKEGAGIKISER